MNQSINSAFAKLSEYDRRSRSFAPDPESSGAPSDEWSGVTFSLGDTRLACNIARISEILPCPQSTPVPGAKPWIVGLANVRGELLTVIDLVHFLSGQRSDDAPLNMLVSRRHRVGTEVWHELDLDRLFNSAEFLNGSAH